MLMLGRLAWETMVTVAMRLTLPLDTWTWAVPAADGAVYRPRWVILPAVADQVKLGWLASALPNWSSACAENCRRLPATTLARAGLVAMAVRVWLTATLTVPVTLRLPESVTVTLKV